LLISRGKISREYIRIAGSVGYEDQMPVVAGQARTRKIEKLLIRTGCCGYPFYRLFSHHSVRSPYPAATLNGNSPRSLSITPAT
jgi:hypothetical protein